MTQYTSGVHGFKPLELNGYWRSGDVWRFVGGAVDAILSRRELVNYHLAHAVRADFCRRLGRTAEACASYEKALSLTQQEPERIFLE